MKRKHWHSYLGLIVTIAVEAIFLVGCKKDKVPTVTTTEVTNITPITASSGGNITNDGGSEVLSRGVCWSKDQNPTTADHYPIDPYIYMTLYDGKGAGRFTSNISYLHVNTTYYVRAYARNSVGINYGNQLSFTTTLAKEINFNPNLIYGSLTDVDGNTYKTIKIGTQTSMAENLKTTKYNDGTIIPLVTDVNIWNNLTTPGYIYILYNNYDQTYKNTLGGLYNWYTVNTGKVCPTGWHVPSDDEWTILITYLGGRDIANSKLRETGITHWGINLGATNESGFTAIPCGYSGGSNGSQSYGYCDFWSSTENGTNTALSQSFSSSGAVRRVNSTKSSGYSIRCLKD